MAYTEAEKAQWVALYASGLSSKKVAIQCGVASRSVLMHLREAGFQVRKIGAPKKYPGMDKKAVAREVFLRKKYGLTEAEYQEMHKAQNGLCAICGCPPSNSGKNGHKLHVDHDHGTGKRRALLCRACNVALGALKDSPELLMKALEYLKRHGKT